METSTAPGRADAPLSEASTSTLLLGNCLELLPTLLDESIDLLCTDPPYGINYKSLSKSLPKTTIENDGEEAYDLLDKALALAVPKLRVNRHVYIFTNWQALAPMAVIVRRYLNLKNVLVWVKNNQTRGDLKGNYGNKYEMLMFAHKGRRHLSGRRDGNVFYFDKVYSGRMRHPCLPAGERIFVDGRWQPIEQVRVGARTNYGTVVKTSTHEARAIVIITLEDGSTTRATENHPFLVARNGNIYWIEAHHLTTQDEILTLEWIHSSLKPVCVKRERDQLPQKDTLELREKNTVAPGLSTPSSRKKRTECQSPGATKSTIETATSKTTELRISSLSIDLRTSGITLVQEGYQTDSGRSNAKTAESGKSLVRSSGTSAMAAYSEDRADLATASEASQLASFSLRKVGSVKTTQTREEKVYNLTIQGIPAFDTLVGVSHNTEKPLALLEYLVKKSTLEGETILDPFCGSASSLVAAKNLGRNYIGMELDKVWFDVARERLGEALFIP